MKRVYVESPYAAPTPEGIAHNVEYAKAAVRDCLQRNEAPYASHLFFTQPGILKDEMPNDRNLGMAAGFCWGEAAELTVVYEDLGVSPGMELGIAAARRNGRPVEYRSLSGWKKP